MRMIRPWLLPVLAFGVVCAAGCSNVTKDTPTPPLSAEDKRKSEEAARQAEAAFRNAQINQSNLTPEQKQNLLRQVKQSGGR